MIITDTISNFFSKLKNGGLSKKYKIKLYKSKQIINLLNLLIKEGFIKSYRISKINKKIIYVYLKYKNNKLIFKNIIRISKPGKRIYIKNKDLFNKKEKFLILTTSIGLLTNIEAKKFNKGGEVLCQIL